MKFFLFIFFLPFLFSNCDPDYNFDQLDFFIVNKTEDNIDAYVEYRNNIHSTDTLRLIPSEKKYIFSNASAGDIDSYLKDLNKIHQDSIFPDFAKIKIFIKGSYVGEEIQSFKNWKIERLNDRTLNLELEIY